MNRGTLFNLVGVLLLAGCLLAASVKLARRSVAEDSGRQVVVRFCHWQLETGLRDAFDRVAAEYTRLHPNVRIEQTAVPGAVYGTYVRTRLAGDNPPDLMEYGVGISDEWLSRHFTPLGERVNQPNPYNVGTDLEGIPWRDTFVDGLGRAPGLDTLQDYYAIPVTMSTVRVFYNVALYRQITGRTVPPSTYEEFMSVCAQIGSYARQAGRKLTPIAGSRFNANVLLDELMRSQTQRLARRIDTLSDLRPPAHPALAFLSGVSLHDRDLAKGLALMREVAGQMQPGFLQFDRDEAMFYFSQQRAVMIATGSWDYQSIVQQSGFEVGVFQIPLPSAGHPEYGPQMLGRRSELSQGTGAYFFLSNKSRHPEQAADFLRFLTSRVGHQLFVDTGKWLPVVRGVKSAAETQAFLPVAEGVPDGFSIAPIMWGNGEMYRIQSNALHVLFSPDGGVDPFLASIEPAFQAAVRQDAEKLRKGYVESVRRLDVGVVAASFANDDAARGRQSGVLETQTTQEADYYWIGHQLEATRDSR